MTPFLKQVGKLVAFIKGKPYTVTSDNEKYSLFEEALNKGVTEDDLLELISNKAKIEKQIKHSGFYFDDNDNLYYNDVKIHEDLGLIVKSFHELYSDFDTEELTSLKLFIDNMIQNPNYEALNDLFSFLQKGKLPITDDGYFLAYKKVRSDFKDIHSGTMDNYPGKTVEMNRKDCNLDRTQTCSTGLHFCSESYLSSFGGYGSIIVEVKINPKDVTSIPNDYNDAKGRCCKYVVTKQISKGDITKTDIIKTIPEPDETTPYEETVQEVETPKELKVPDSSTSKTCSKCNYPKLKTEFHKRKDSKDGYRGVCKECIKKQKKAKK
jgi:hypothetical protein